MVERDCGLQTGIASPRLSPSRRQLPLNEVYILFMLHCSFVIMHLSIDQVFVNRERIVLKSRLPLFLSLLPQIAERIGWCGRYWGISIRWCVWRLRLGGRRPLTPSPEPRDINPELWIWNLQAIQLRGFPHFSELHSPFQPRLNFAPNRRDLPRVRDFAPSTKKGTGQAHRDTESTDFRGLQHIATVCEPCATMSAVNPQLKQFATDCNHRPQQRPLPDSQRSGSGT
jgi:hypothetical protein